MSKNICLICGKPVGKTKAYCKEHNEYAEHDNKIIEDAPFEVLFCLIEGIFERARDDYIYDTDGERSDAEWFFRSEWAQELSLSKFDPEAVLKQMDEEITDGD